MRRWRPLSSSRSRNVISSPQATRVAFVSPFRIPSLCEGGRGTGTGIKLQWKSTHSTLHHRRPLLFSSSYCQRREKRVNKILLCNVLLVSRFCFAVLPSTSLSLSLVFPVIALSCVHPSLPEQERRESLPSLDRSTDPTWLLLLSFNYLVRFKFVIIISMKNKPRQIRRG